MTNCTVQTRWPSRACPLLQEFGRKKLAGFPRNISSLIYSDRRTGQPRVYFKECMKLSPGWRSNVLETAFFFGNNDLGLFNKFFLELNNEDQFSLLKQLNEPEDAPTLPIRLLQISSIGRLIGTKGNNIKMLQEKTRAAIDVDDFGRVIVSALDRKIADRAAAAVAMFMDGPEVGKVYKSRITKIVDFGVFAEILPGTEGFIHVRELSHSKIEAEDIKNLCAEGMKVLVKVMDVEDHSFGDRRIRLSVKKVTEEDAANFDEE